MHARPAIQPAPNNAVAQAGRTYAAQIRAMVAEEATTLPVDFQDLLQHDEELAETLLAEHYRFEPALRQALAATVEDTRAQMREEAANPGEVPEAEPDREFMVAFHNLPSVMKCVAAPAAAAGGGGPDASPCAGCVRCAPSRWAA